MVGIGAGLRHNGNGLVHVDAVLLHEADKLRDNHGRMGVVNLDNRVLVQIPQGIALLGKFLNNKLCAGAHHEILLVHSQKPAGPVAVVGIQEQGQVPGNVMLVKVNVPGDNRFVRCLHVKQVQAVHAVFIACHLDVIHHRLQFPLGEGHPEPGVSLFGPAGGGEPVFRLFPLLMIPELLPEQPEVVEKPHAVGRQAQSGGRVQIAGG